MDKSEAIKQTQVLEKELAALKKIIESPDVTAEARFLQLVENVEIKRDSERFPNSVFFFNGEKLLAEYDCNFPEKLWISWDIWEVFVNEYKMQYVEVKEFMRKQVEKHFKMKVSELVLGDAGIERRVEKHFKVKASEH